MTPMSAPIRFIKRDSEPQSPVSLEGYSDIVKTLLINRNIHTLEDAETLIDGDYESGLHDPFLMKDMDKAVERVRRALSEHERVAVFSDYDADGVPGGVALRSFLERVGLEDVETYIPHRGVEGFGLNNEAIDILKEKGVTLIITVDCGITDVEEVAYARELGIDVIITDHHLPHVTLPDAVAILDPHQDGCAYPFKELCGAGVVYKLIQALIKQEDIDFPEGHEKWLLDLVGIATLADMVPIVDENRIFARYGLLVLKKGRRPGLRELFTQARTDYRFVSEEDISFTVAPRINAASRMAHPDIAFSLLSAKTHRDATKFALELEAINNERKTLVAQIVREVKKKISKRELRSVIVVGNPHWRPGILGLIASSLVDAFGKTVFVWGREGEGEIKGSVRSNGMLNVVDLMGELPEGTFIRFGGHEKSAGFSIEIDKVDVLEDLLNIRAGQATVPEDVGARLYDLEMPADNLSSELFEDVLQLAPFGVGFEKPVFKLEEARVLSVREFGKSKNHLEIAIEGRAGARFNSIGFFMTRKSFERDIDVGESITMYGSLERSYFGRTTPEYRIRIEHLE